MPRVAFQGELGAFSEEAVRRFFGDTAEPIPQREFADVARAVVERDVDYGLLPIENTLAGSVVPSYDVLAAGTLEVIGEVVTPIHHCVLAPEGAALDGLQRVLSHPVALAQCTRFLRARPKLDAMAVYDTAGAARDVAARGDVATGAIAGRAAADRYGLVILGADVEDRHDNQTRFLVVVRRDGEHRPLEAVQATPELPHEHGEELRPTAAVRTAGTRMKTALLVETDNSPGALVRVLLPFANRGINLSKLESRPGERPWTYRFFVELETDAAEATAGEAVEQVREQASSLLVLGSYPRAR